MAISTQRNKYLDDETFKGTVKLTDIDGNDVFSPEGEGEEVTGMVGSEAGVGTSPDTESSLDKNDKPNKKEAFSILTKAIEFTDNVLNTIEDLEKKALATISKALDAVIDGILAAGAAISKGIKNMLNKITGLLPDGVKQFLKDVLSIGKIFLCNNINLTIKLSKGYKIDFSILKGVVGGLLLAWLDKQCQEFNQNEMPRFTNTMLVKTLAKVGELDIKPKTATETYRALMHGEYKANLTIIPRKQNLGTPYNIVYDIRTTGLDQTTRLNISEGELTKAEKQPWLDEIDSQLLLATPGSVEYNNLLDARAEFIKAPAISKERALKASEEEHLEDTIAEFINEYTPSLTDNISLHGLPPEEIAIMRKMDDFVMTTKNDPAFKARAKSNIGYKGFQFDFPAFTIEEQQLIQQTEDMAYILYFEGLETSTEVYLDGTTPLMALDLHNKEKLERKRNAQKDRAITLDRDIPSVVEEPTTNGVISSTNTPVSSPMGSSIGGEINNGSNDDNPLEVPIARMDRIKTPSTRKCSVLSNVNFG